MKIENLLGLLILAIFALACANGETVTPGKTINENAIGGRIPENIISSFVDIPGGRFTPGTEATTITVSTVPGLREIENIDSFRIMDSEVTIEMYVDFLNAVPPPSFNGGASSSTANDDHDDHFRTGMINTIYGGIFVTDSTGAKVVLDGGDLGGGIFNSTSNTDDFLAKAGVQTKSGAPPKSSSSPSNKPLQTEYIDPFQTSVRSKARMTNHSGEDGFIYHVQPGRRWIPISLVSKIDAFAFCRWLGSQYRLPTDSEWEYCARGGNDTGIDFPTGDAYDPYTGTVIGSAIRVNHTEQQFYDFMHNAANFQGEYEEKSEPTNVKSYSSNGYGLYDMAGNLFEWTVSSPLEGFANITFSAIEDSYLRGGSWASRNIKELTVWSRLYQPTDDNYFSDVGFRVVFSKSRVVTAGESLGTSDPDI